MTRHHGNITLFWGRLGLVLLSLTLLVPQTAAGIDKRAYVHILPPKTHATFLAFVDVNASSRQYRPDGMLQSRTENESRVAKIISRFLLRRNLELSFDVPYFLERSQTQTNAAGILSERFDSEGLGDISIQLTWQLRDSRQGGWGLIAGLELKCPTGKQENGLGTGTWDGSVRSAVTYKTPLGFPYGLLIYTNSGEDTQETVRTTPGDELYLAVGLKSRFWNGFAVDASLFRAVGINDSISARNRQPVFKEKRDTSGWKVMGRYRFNRHVEWMVFYEMLTAEDAPVVFMGARLERRNDERYRVGTVLKFFW